MWNSAIWNEIVDIPKTTVYEVENITAAAGVRGAEAEDEILKYLWSVSYTHLTLPTNREV